MFRLQGLVALGLYELLSLLLSKDEAHNAGSQSLRVRAFGFKN